MNSLSAPSILIVDDQLSVCKLLSQYLNAQSFRCRHETSASLAIKRMQEISFDLAIVDIMMPEVSGIELLKQILLQFPRTAVIMLSGLTEVDIATQCLKLGAADYLVKPVNFKQLKAAIHRALERQNLRIRRRDLQNYLQTEIQNKTQEIRSLFLSTIEALVGSLEAKDSCTEGHSRRVTIYSLFIGKKLNLDDQLLNNIRITGILHDIGKIGISEAILNKPGSLSDSEFKVIKQHPIIAEQILRSIPQLDEIRKAIRHHHERYDGAGYPDGLKGEDIPLISRIIAVADCYDAMISDRPYRSALSKEIAIDEIMKNKGSQFDPKIVDAFTGIDFDSGDLLQLIAYTQHSDVWRSMIFTETA